MLRIVQNEKGVLLLAAILLLLILSFSLFSTIAAYQSKYRTYDSLEIGNINATIIKMDKFKQTENNPDM